jgi:hypothetical protein
MNVLMVSLRKLRSTAPLPWPPCTCERNPS